MIIKLHNISLSLSLSLSLSPQNTPYIELHITAWVEEVSKQRSCLVHHARVIQEVREGGEVRLLVQGVADEGVRVCPY